MKVLVGRVVWAAGLAAVGVLTAGVQMDYGSRSQFGLSEKVPAIFQSMALERRAQDALSQGDTKTGEALARAELRRRPIPASGLSLLGLAAAGQREDELATQAFMLAAARGWRDRVAQLAMVNFALSAEADEVAAQRLAALWSTGEQDDPVIGATEAVMASPGARKAFASQLARNDGWQANFVKWATANLEPDILISVIGEAREAGARFECAQQSALAAALMDKGEAKAAVQLWQASCGQGGGNAAGSDFSGLEDVGQVSGPFAWTYPANGSLVRNALAQKDGVGIQYNNTGHIFLVLARRYMALPAGTHRVTARFEGAAPQVQIVCRGSGESAPVQQRLVLRDGEAVPFSVPQSGCSSQRLDIRVSRGEGTIVHFGVE